jgi:ABC-2 type transport system ATP-binding protein
MAELKQQGKTIFFSTHVIADVEAVCDRVGIIAEGELRANHEVAQVLQEGVEGYNIQASGCSPEQFSDFTVSESRTAGHFSVTVPVNRHQEFMQRLFVNGGQVELVEPRRRSLEALFLKIIDQVP